MAEDLEAALEALAQGAPTDAVPLAERALMAVPGDAEACAVLGLAICLTGDAAGLERINLAIASEPREPRWHLYLARALSTLGNHDDARLAHAAASRLADFAPAAVIPQIGYLTQVGDPAAAYDAAVAARRQRPNDPVMVRLVARTGGPAGHHAAAHHAATIVARSTIATPKDHLRRAQLAIDLSRYDEASDILSSLWRTRPTPEVALSLAKLRAFAGRLPEAEAILRRALGVAPMIAPLWTLLLGLPGASEQDAAAAARLLPSGINKPLRLALARFALRNGDAAQAMELAREAHIGAAPWDWRGVQGHIDWAYDAYVKTAPTGQTADPPNNIYLCGAPRSGGSLIQARLCTAFDAASVGERGSLPLHFLRQHGTTLSQPDIEKLRQADLRGLKQQCGGSSQTIDKTPQNAIVAGLLSRVHPNAQLVRNRRDLREVALSIWFHDLPPIYGYGSRVLDIARYLRLHDDALDGWQDRGVSFIETDHTDIVAGGVRSLAARLDMAPRPTVDQGEDSHQADVWVPTHSFAQARKDVAPAPSRFPAIEAFLTDEERGALEGL